MKYRICLSHAAMAVLVLLATGCAPARANQQTILQSEVQEVVVESVEVRLDDGVGSLPTTEAADYQIAPLQDGKSLLESRCARCHLVDTLEQMEKSRDEWEGILAQMQRIGVQISVREEAVLLDYLTKINEP